MSADDNGADPHDARAAARARLDRAGAAVNAGSAARLTVTSAHAVQAPLPLVGATEPHADGMRIASVDGAFYLYPAPAAGPRTQAEAGAEAERVSALVWAAAQAAAREARTSEDAEADLRAALVDARDNAPDEWAAMLEKSDEWCDAHPDAAPWSTDEARAAGAADFAALLVPAVAAGAAAAGTLRADLERDGGPLTDAEETALGLVGAYLSGVVQGERLGEREAEAPPAEPKKRGRTDLVAFTAPPFAALEQAVSAAAVAHGRFGLVDGNRRLVYMGDKAGYTVAVDYADPVASVDEALSGIAEHVGIEAVFMVAAAGYHALEHEGEPVNAEDVLLDIGWRRDRDGIRETRAEAIDRVARMYLRLNAWAVIGEGWGPHPFADPKGRPIDVSSRGPLFMTTAMDDTQGSLLGRPSVVGFTFRRGEFLARVAAHPHVLETFGTYRELARMPRQRPADAWAVSIGLALVQRWRELAPHSRVTKPGEKNLPVVHVQRMKRRYLLTQYPPKPTPEDVLYERDEATGATKPRAKGKRDAQTYWTKALANLHAAGVIDDDVRGRLAGEPTKLPRRGWGEAWLDEALDGRPPEGYKAEFLTLAERTEEHTKKARRRQARRKPKGDT